MSFKSALVALSMMVAGVSAQATTLDWGHHDNIEYGSVFHNAGAFEDIFHFNLVPAVDLLSTAVSNNIPTVTNITGGQVELYYGSYWDAAADTLVGSYTFDGTTGSSPSMLSNLGTGDYYYRVTGTATGTAGGFYTISSAPVPEPETYAMLLAGLGATLVARRRSKKSA